MAPHAALLGVTVGCTQSELKKAYRRAALREHPDKAVGITSEEANARFQAVFKAYEALGRSTQEEGGVQSL